MPVGPEKSASRFWRAAGKMHNFLRAGACGGSSEEFLSRYGPTHCGFGHVLAALGWWGLACPTEKAKSPL